MEIRYLKDSDKAGLCKLSHQINKQHFEKEPKYFCNPGKEGDDWEFWKNSHEKEGGFVLVAVLNEEIAGFVAAEMSDMPNLPFLNPMKRCRIATIVVSRKCQRRGIGTAMYESVYKIAKEYGASDLNLEVFSFNRSAIAFYEKLGFINSSHRMSMPIAL
ncbi:GNAT family N-acetyltransferase [Teredinibacter sp. KSP-S5-2]|uniref:GNAT family N-acetyltransferase n=1 Tax=Teredinibacter sp. KSP-S5-2 TaxID=3034506 RepID=UPI00293420A9|nr:GNAT family N-acetyltransferase [Teredinibacter sp. KSP-S5-2]WNO09985.1 GNAT family N-acetyltransferase [Teredinibacter sp. KSP-S5-2]